MTRDVQLARQDLLVDPDRVFVVKGGESVRGETRGKGRRVMEKRNMTMYDSRQTMDPRYGFTRLVASNKHMATSPQKTAPLTQPRCVALYSITAEIIV